MGLARVSRTRRGLEHGAARRAAAVLATMTFAVVSSGCSSDDGTPDSRSSTSTSTSTSASTSDGSTAGLEATSSSETAFEPTSGTSSVTTDSTGPGADVTGTGDDTGDASCPTHIRTERISSLVDISFGWTGQGHGADPVDGMVLSYELFDCDDDCRRCRFQGPVPNLPGTPNDPRRCLNDWPTQCESDADCDDAEGACQFTFQPPVQRTTTWQAAYAPRLTEEQQARFGTDSDYGAQGVVDLTSGDLDFEVLNTRVTLGPGFAETCDGDATPDDGIRDGTCADSGDPCDIATLSANGALSFDCDWTPNPIDFALPAHGLTSGGVLWTMNDTRPECTFPGVEGVRCWCGVCSNDETQPCQLDSQCDGGTCGNPGTKDDPIVTLPNACAPGETCDWSPSDVFGTCMGQSGAVVPCFPAQGAWSVSGSTSVQTDFFTSTVALLSCLPQVDPDRLIILDPVNDVSLDEAFGFPGPIVQVLPLKITPETR